MTRGRLEELADDGLQSYLADRDDPIPARLAKLEATRVGKGEAFWRGLLVKYIAHVDHHSGVNYWRSGWRWPGGTLGAPGGPDFTPAEWEALTTAAREGREG